MEVKKGGKVGGKGWGNGSEEEWQSRCRGVKEWK